MAGAPLPGQSLGLLRGSCPVCPSASVGLPQVAPDMEPPGEWLPLTQGASVTTAPPQPP